MSAQNSRKRPAPGSAPLLPVATSPPGQQDQMMRWSNALPEATSINEATRNNNGYIVGPIGNQYLQQPLQPGLSQAASKLHSQSMPPSSQPQAAPMSTAIARRPPNRALVPSVPRSSFDVSADPWATFPDDGTGGSGLVSGGHPGENVSIEILEERAQRIIKEAQAKRKQIPPFVQKLSSFLEEEKNTDLIRWSANGDSFIVLDEDEFAKTLIPELFKHNNYASFVRQLNMYGFHKRVGLSDNSMKASERKNKSPSEYYNPYFRRGHPNLLWLINKPKSGSKSKKGKKDDGDGDSDEEGGIEEPLSLNYPTLAGQASRPYGPSGGGGGNAGFVGGSGVSGGGSSGVSGGGGGSSSSGELGPLQRKDLQLIKEELNTLQSRQAQISKVMQRLQYDNGKLQQQARMFQNMHDRHENSINAILNFLANVFRKSLEEQGSVQGVTELLASILPNGQIPQGSVVDLGDEFERRSSMASSISTPPPKRPQRLLPPIPANGLSALHSASSTSRSGGASGLRSVASPTSVHSVMGGAKMASSNSSSGHSGNSGNLASYFPGLKIGQVGSVTELADSPNDLSATTSNSSLLQQELQTNPQEGMMRIINDTNASISSPNSAIDLSEMVASTPVTLSNDQRSRVLSLMSAQHGGGGIPATSGTILPSTTGGTVGNLSMPVANMDGMVPKSTASMPAPMLAATTRRDGRGGYSMPPSQASLTGAHMGGASGLGLLGNGVSYGGGLGATASTGAGTDPSGMMTSSGLALSPILSSVPGIQPPSLQDISNTQAEIEALQRLQDEQNAKISDLSQLLGPLSPSGRIPGIDDDAGVVLPGSGHGGVGGGGGGGVGLGGVSGSGNPEYFDLSQYLDSNAFGDDFNFATNDMGMEGDGITTDHIQQQQQQMQQQMQQQQQHQQPQQQLGDPTDTGDGVDDFNFGIDSIKTGVSTENTSSPATTEEILRTDFKSDSPDSTAKRRRVI